MTRDRLCRLITKTVLVVSVVVLVCMAPAPALMFVAALWVFH